MKKFNVKVLLASLLVGFLKESSGAPGHVGFTKLGNYCEFLRELKVMNDSKVRRSQTS